MFRRPWSIQIKFLEEICFKNLMAESVVVAQNCLMKAGFNLLIFNIIHMHIYQSFMTWIAGSLNHTITTEIGIKGYLIIF